MTVTWAALRKRRTTTTLRRQRNPTIPTTMGLQIWRWRRARFNATAVATMADPGRTMSRPPFSATTRPRCDQERRRRHHSHDDHHHRHRLSMQAHSQSVATMPFSHQSVGSKRRTRWTQTTAMLSTMRRTRLAWEKRRKGYHRRRLCRRRSHIGRGTELSPPLPATTTVVTAARGSTRCVRCHRLPLIWKAIAEVNQRGPCARRTVSPIPHSAVLTRRAQHRRATPHFRTAVPRLLRYARGLRRRPRTRVTGPFLST
jgi:hypothetical protein